MNTLFRLLRFFLNSLISLQFLTHGLTGRQIGGHCSRGRIRFPITGPRYYNREPAYPLWVHAKAFPTAGAGRGLRRPGPPK